MFCLCLLGSVWWWLGLWNKSDSVATWARGQWGHWRWPFSHECWARVACSSPLAVPCVCHGERAQQSSCSAAHLLCSQRRALNYPKETNAWCKLKIPDIRTCQKFCVSCGGGFRNVLRGYQNLLLSQFCFWMMCQHLFKVNIERLVGIIRKNFHK